MPVKLVKSVKRTLEILELFDRERRPLPAVDISEKLGYPLASTHEILKTLVELEYFSYGEPKWAYVPSRNFPGVVDWVQDRTGDYSRLLDFMVALNQVTKETINLSRRTLAGAKIIQGYECLHQVGVSSMPGTTMPVTQSLTGIVGLASMDDIELENFLAKLNDFDPQQYAAIDRPLLASICDEVRTEGMAMRCDLRVEGIGAICFPVKSETTQETLVIGVVGPSDRIEKQATDHKQTIKKLVERFRVTTTFPTKQVS